MSSKGFAHESQEFADRFFRGIIQMTFDHVLLASIVEMLRKSRNR
jgi:hypothetical protein